MKNLSFDIFTKVSTLLFPYYCYYSSHRHHRCCCHCYHHNYYRLLLLLSLFLLPPIPLSIIITHHSHCQHSNFFSFFFYKYIHVIIKIEIDRIKICIKLNSIINYKSFKKFQIIHLNTTLNDPNISGMLNFDVH